MPVGPGRTRGLRESRRLRSYSPLALVPCNCSCPLPTGCGAGEQGGTRKKPGLTNCSASCPGARAEVDADQVATVVWNYFRQLGDNAKEAVEQIQKSELPRQLK